MTLKKIAKIVRAVVEQDAIEDSSISCWSNLSGACGYASYGLYRVLPDSELVIGRFNGIGHAWVELDNKIIDITATQFDIRDEVYIVKKNGNRANSYIPTVRGQTAVISLKNWQYPNGWREDLAKRLKEEVKHLVV